VVAIGGTPLQPRYGEEPAIEYAVRMRQFDHTRQLDRLQRSGELDTAMIEAVARTVAAFHQGIAGRRPPPGLGSPEQVWQPMGQNFTQIRALVQAPDPAGRLDALQRWSEQRYRALHARLAARRQEGFVRECHGDMHLANMAWVDGAPLIFDGIEFNPALYWIDVYSEIAFVVMDLHQHGRSELAWRFLNTWLEESGDVAGLPLLDFYLVYRAMVRAKVAAIRLSQLSGDTAAYAEAQQALQRYLALAASFTHARQPRVLICHGLSGSGKTWLGMQLLERIGGIRLRSDVERKRLFGLDSRQRAEQDHYSQSATEQTYRHLAELASGIIDCGYTVLVDATFLDAAQRQRFRELARAKGCPFHILAFTAREAVLRQRLAQRRHDASDADEAVLSRQLAQYRPLGAEEQKEVLRIDSEQDAPLHEALSSLLSTSARNGAERDG
jgi:uncharacterized protein